MGLPLNQMVNFELFFNDFLIIHQKTYHVSNC